VESGCFALRASSRTSSSNGKRDVNRLKLSVRFSNLASIKRSGYTERNEVKGGNVEQEVWSRRGEGDKREVRVLIALGGIRGGRLGWVTGSTPAKLAKIMEEGGEKAKKKKRKNSGAGHQHNRRFCRGAVLTVSGK